MKKCLNCGKDIFPRKYVKYKNLKYCNSTCNAKYRSKIYEIYKKFKKDKCECCGVKEGISEYWFNRRLCVHHIDNDPSNNNESNLITLCKECHSKNHRRNTINQNLMFVLK